MHTPHDLSSSPEVLHAAPPAGDDLCLLVHVESSHAVVEHGGHDRYMEEVVESPGEVVEVLLSERTLLLPRGDRVVVVEGCLELRRGDSHLCRQLSARSDSLHQSPPAVVFAVPLDLLRGLPVQNQTVGPSLVLPHAPSHVVTVAELVSEPVALVVQEHPPHTSEGLCGEELDLRVGFLQVHKPSRVHLDLLHVNNPCACALCHLDAVPCAVLPVGGGKVQQVRTVNAEEGVRGEVRSVPSCCDHDDSLLRERLALSVGVLDPCDGPTAVCGQSVDFGLRDHPGPIRGRLRDGLQLLHQGVRDGHPWKPLLSSVGPLERVTSQTRDEGEVQRECRLEPLNGGTRVVGKCLDELRTAEVPGGLCRVGVEGFRGVLDSLLYLGLSERSVDSARGLRRVPSHERTLVNHHHSPPLFEDRVRSRQPCKSSTHNDHLIETHLDR
mmetsp:Transcript_12217/g.23661  ORF Transcript_12217/g.23661 Transcript_12217/m.23661 type:complete len:439 (+) Transcript_12217:364-1680(+)